MADSFTVNFNFTLTEVGASQDTWGGKLNANWTDIDALLIGFLPLAGGTMSGPLAFADTGYNYAFLPETGRFALIAGETPVTFYSLAIDDFADSFAHHEFFAADAVTAYALAATLGPNTSDAVSVSTLITRFKGDTRYGQLAAADNIFTGDMEIQGNLLALASTAKILDQVLLAAAGITDLVDIADQAEAEAGTADDLAMTPLRTAEAIAAQTVSGVVMTGLMTSAGGTTYSSGAAGVLTRPGTGHYRWTWDVAQPNAEYVVQVTPFDAGGSGGTVAESVSLITTALFEYRTFAGTGAIDRGANISVMRA